MDADPVVIRTSVPRQIADFVRRAIERGDLEPGAMLPSEHELAERYRASVGAVRQGLAMLVAEGRIIKANGKRATVRGRPGPAQVINRTPDDPWTHLTPVGEPDNHRENARPRTAVMLGVEEGAPLFTVTRPARHATGRPVLTRRILPASAYNGLDDYPDPFGPRETIMTALAERHGPLTTAERVRPLLPDSDERQALNLAPGDLVIEITRITRSRDGAALLAESERHGEGAEPEYPLN